MNEQQIDKYLMNLLSVDERALFEEEMKNNESLRTQVNIQSDAMKSIESMGRARLKSKLQDIHSDLYSKQKSSKTNIRQLIYRMTAAAVFIGLIAFTWLWMQGDASPAELYSQHFEPYELSLAERSNANDTYVTIEQLYEEGKYAALTPILQEEIKNGNQSSQLLLALGIAHMKQNEPSAAIKQFETILDNNDFNFEDEANWYIGLCYLKLGDEENVKRYFNILASDTSRDHHEEAKEILNQLE